MLCRKCKIEIPHGSPYCNWCGAKQETVRRRAHKRANGSGSVYKLPGDRSRPWVAMARAVPNDDGDLHRKVIGYYATKKEAEAAIAVDCIMPVGEYAHVTLKGLFDMWKETKAFTDLTRQTQDNYRAAFAYLSDYHTQKFADLRTAQFQDAVDKAEDMGRSHSTMEKIKALCTILSEYAYSQDITRKNYAAGIRLPKDQKKKKEVFTDMEISKLFKNDALPMVDTILILIYTGMRIRELLTLTKFNVDLDTMVITGGSKTEAGTDRIIPIHPKIQPYIRARYQQAQNYLLEHGREVGNKKKGTFKTIRVPYRYEYYCDLYYAVLDQLEIRRLTPHKARHTFFTQVTAKSNDRKAIAVVGGHTDPNFTDKTYVQPDVERLRRAVESI